LQAKLFIGALPLRVASPPETLWQLFRVHFDNAVRADPNLSHRADRILRRGGKPTF
jgi:hypothetical protein